VKVSKFSSLSSPEEHSILMELELNLCWGWFYSHWERIENLEEWKLTFRSLEILLSVNFFLLYKGRLPHKMSFLNTKKAFCGSRICVIVSCEGTGMLFTTVAVSGLGGNL
jgi:hypothetical protein